MTLRNISSIICCAAISANAFGATFDELVSTIVSNSPTLEASRARMASELESVKADNALPDPQIEFERLWRSGEGENRWSAGISQEIDWPGTYSARKNTAVSLREAQEAQICSEERNERLRAAQLLVEIISANKEIALLSEINSSMKELQDKYMLAWENGETTILDVNKIKIETIRSAAALESAQSRLRSLQGELKAMAGADASTITVPADLEFPYTVLQNENDYMAALQTAPEIRMLQRMAEVARNETSIAKSTRFPGLSIGYSHAYEDGAHFNGFSIGLSLPVWSRTHKINATAASELSARFTMIARTAELENSLQADYANACSLESQMNDFGPVVDGVNNLALLHKALLGGELNLLSYIQEVNYFLEAQLDYLNIRKEYTLVAIRLNSLLAE